MVGCWLFVCDCQIQSITVLKNVCASDNNDGSTIILITSEIVQTDQIVFKENRKTVEFWPSSLYFSAPLIPPDCRLGHPPRTVMSERRPHWSSLDLLKLWAELWVSVPTLPGVSTPLRSVRSHYTMQMINHSGIPSPQTFPGQLIYRRVSVCVCVCVCVRMFIYLKK